MKRSPVWASIFVIILGGGLGAANEAYALTSLKQVQVTNGSRVDLLFDGKISPSQIRTDFFNDTIQISLTDVSVYPAKISSVTGGSLVKVFAYQYAPKLVRCRLTVKGQAENFKSQFSAVPSGPSGKTLAITLAPEKSSSEVQVDRLTTHAAQAAREEPRRGGTEGSAAAATPPAPAPIEEQALLEHVLKGRPAAESKAIPEKVESAPVKPLATGKPLPSLMRVFGKLAAVVGCLGLLLIGIKKAGRKNSSNRIFGAINRFARNGVSGIRGRGKLIEVVSNHYLGPKKSIAVVKVAGRMLVIGISNESINLITQLSPGESSRDLSNELPNGIMDQLGIGGDPATHEAGPGSPAAAAEPDLVGFLGGSAKKKDLFSALLDTEQGKPARSYAAPAPAPVAPRPDAERRVRSQIRAKLEGLKPL